MGKIDDSNMEYIHWLCCSYLQNNKKAEEVLNKLIADGFSKKSIEHEINKIQTNGIEPQEHIKEGCYIATAVYGSYNAPEVFVLRKFRDEILKENILGRLFIKFYYTVSPALANKLKNMKHVNRFVKNRLDKFVEILKEKY